MTYDPHAKKETAIDQPARLATEIIPSDTVEFAMASRAMYIGGRGDLKVVMADGAEVTFVNASGILPLMVKQVLDTGTTATSIISLG